MKKQNDNSETIFCHDSEKKKDIPYYCYDFDAGYLEDILSGKLRIYDVPEEYRTDTAYIYSFRWVRDVCRTQYSGSYAYTEKKMIEELLLRDIMRLHTKNPELAKVLHRLHEEYFYMCSLYDNRYTGLL